jgi:hypothetical protein
MPAVESSPLSIWHLMCVLERWTDGAFNVVGCHSRESQSDAGESPV